MQYPCPVCGYPEMDSPPRDYNICECCGTEFGLHDQDMTHKELRIQWLTIAAPWWHGFPQNGWNALEQLKRAGFIEGESVKPWPPRKPLPITDHASGTNSGTTSQVNASIASPRSVRLTIMGQVYSMKNSKIPRRNGPGMLKHPKARQFERDFLMQVRPEHRKELGSKKRPLRVAVRVFYPSNRQDLDAELIMDLLQKSQIILNDRYIVEKHLFRELDKRNPRCEICVEEI